ncbi:MAG: alpha/beta hydrolase, partial [Bdellovibrionaceae bacterium]|nr:alpha/beta hydrolase [Pseudobdellovibrionaceae bacterium]
MAERWVWIRGLIRGAGHWGDFPEIAAAERPHLLIEHLELPGNGSRCEEVSPWNIQGYVQDLRERCESLRTGPISVLAHSLGGMVALQWAADHPGDFLRLVVINTSASDLSLPWERFRPLEWRFLLRAFFEKNPRLRERWILETIANNQSRVDQLLPMLADFSESHPVRYQNLVRQLFAASGFRLPSVKVPTRVLASRGDRLVRVENSERLA